MAKIGIIGTGWGARVQVPTFREAGLEVVAIAGHNAAKTAALAGELGIRAESDWRAVATAGDVDLVSIVTPPSEHHEMALAALAGGKHVLLEKPTAMSVKQAEELVTAAGNHRDQLTLIDHELRFLPSWREARAKIDGIGPVRYAEVRYSSPSRGDRTREWTWWSDATRGGGIWGAVGSHFVDALRYFGVEFESARATLRTMIGERPSANGPRKVTADDFVSAEFQLRGAGVVVMTFSAVATGPDEPSRMTIYGERGAMRFTGEEVTISTGGAAFTTLAGGAMEERPGNSFGGAFGSGTLHLGRALREALDDGNRDALAPAATFDDGLMQQRILDAARESSRNGGWVRV